jgi:hypothetical protein
MAHEKSDRFAPNQEPLVVSYGMGLDSTAVLALLYSLGIRPDLILFADTGAEKPETYAYLEIINAWLEEVGFPTVTVVAYVPVRAPYSTLEGACIANEVLPALAYGQHQCALRFKRDVLNKFLKTWAPGQAAIAAGKRIQKIIGYDAGTSDLKRSAKALRLQAKVRESIAKRLEELGKAPLADQWEAAHCEIRPLLQEHDLKREALAAVIEKVGLPIPSKSACWFCPASKLGEVMDLKRDHPDLFERAVALEDRARAGKHGLKRPGLGISWAWGWVRDLDTIEEAQAEIARRGGKVSKTLRP